MYYINKLVWFFLNPVMVALVLLAAAIALTYWRRVRLAMAAVAASALWLWLWGTGLMTFALGLPLESPYLDTQDAEKLPNADAIVLLGGSMGKAPGMRYAEMFTGADRVWHAARLFKAGKAPRVVLSGADSEETTLPLLLDFGVPRNAILIDGESRNTYENARFTERLLNPGATILLVTSAWHETRARGNFAKTSLKVIPAATDFETTFYWRSSKGIDLVCSLLVPNAGAWMFNSVLAKEWLGRLARR